MEFVSVGGLRMLELPARSRSTIETDTAVNGAAAPSASPSATVHGLVAVDENFGRRDRSLDAASPSRQWRASNSYTQERATA